MKRLLMINLLMAVWLLSCQEEEMTPPSQKVQFTFAMADSPNSAGRAQSDLPDDASLVISISDNSGNPVLTHHRLDILEMGNSYISEPLDLDAGRYRIADFFITSGSEVVYAAPKKGSALAPLITTPLPHPFGVRADDVTNVSVDVIDARYNAPEDFGYAAFGINIISPLRVAVFIEEYGEMHFADAGASVHTIIGGLHHITDYPLSAKVNTLPLEGGPDNTYTLTIRKAGYKIYTKTFRYSELIEELGDEPLTVILERAVTIQYSNTNQSYSFWLQFTGSGSVTVSWGDGQEETVDFGPDASAEVYLSHQYSSMQSWFPVDITGDIGAITGIRSTASGLTRLNTMFATSLSALSIDNGTSGDLDLTRNYQLRTLRLSNGFYDQIYLPDYHYIEHLEMVNIETNIHGDAIINNIYSVAVFRNIRNGNFVYHNAEPAPSPEAMQKLEDLRDSYGWTISVE